MPVQMEARDKEVQGKNECAEDERGDEGSYSSSNALRLLLRLISALLGKRHGCGG